MSSFVWISWLSGLCWCVLKIASVYVDVSLAFQAVSSIMQT